MPKPIFSVLSILDGILFQQRMMFLCLANLCAWQICVLTAVNSFLNLYICTFEHVHVEPHDLVAHFITVCFSSMNEQCLFCEVHM